MDTTKCSTSGGCCFVCKIVGGLVIIGAINWGLVGLMGLDLVAKLLGPMSTPSRIVYGLVGIAGVMKVVMCIKPCPCCTNKSGT